MAEELINLVTPPIDGDPRAVLGRVYLASGWFNEKQEERRAFVKQAIIDAGFDIFSPKDEALVDPTSSQDWREQVFKNNIKGITNAPFIVCITDEKDIGTIMEAGIAYSLNIPIVYFAETLGDNPFNLMLAQSGIVACTSRDELVKVLNDDTLLNVVLHNLSVGDCTNVRYEDYEGTVE